MWTLRFTIGICLFLAIRGLGIAWVTLDQLALYRQLEAAGSPILRSGINASFGIALLIVAWGLYRQRAWAIQQFWGIIAAYLAFSWVWLAIYAQADFDRGRLAFSSVTSGVLVGLLWWLRLRLRKIFGENHE
jgi:hypothetical protein